LSEEERAAEEAARIAHEEAARAAAEEEARLALLAQAREQALAEDGTTGGQSLEVLRADQLAIRALLDRRLPEDLNTERLFVVNLDDEAAVQERVRTLARNVEHRRQALELLGDSLTPEERQRGEALLGLVEARLRFLSTPQRVRRAVREAEGQARELLRLQEQAHEERRAAELEEAQARVAQAQATNEARTATSEEERRFSTEVARLERIRGDIAAARASWTDVQSAATQRSQQRVERLMALTDEFGGADPLDAAAYDALAAEAAQARGDLRDALAAVESAASGPLAPAAPTDAVLVGLRDDQQARLQALHADVEQATLRLQRDRQEARLRTLWEVARHEAELEHLRQNALLRLDRAALRPRLGLSETGLNTLFGELERLALVLRVTRHRLVHPSSDLRNVLFLSRLMLRGLLVLAVGLLWRTLRRRNWPMRDLIRDGLRRVRRRRRWRKVATVGLSVLRAWPEALTLLLITFAGWILGDLRQVPVIALGWALTWWIGIYRLAIALAYALLIPQQGAAAGTGLEESGTHERTHTGSLQAVDPHAGRVLRSLRLVGRWMLAVGVVLQVAYAALGPGWLYSFTRTFAGWLALPIAWRLLRWWSPWLLTQAAERFPRVARFEWWTRVQPPSLWALPVGLIAAGALVGLGGLQAVQRFAMRFEQSRRAVAFLFRRRLERSSSRRGHDTLTPLSGPMRETLLAPLTVRDLQDAHSETCLQAMLEDVSAWRTSDRVGSFLLVADPGHGRDTWLQWARNELPAGLPACLWEPPSRMLEAAALCEALSRALGVPPCHDVNTLVDRVLALPERRVVFINRLELLTLRGVGTGGAWAAMEQLIHETGGHLYWAFCMSDRAWSYTQWRGRGNAFREVVRMEAWEERDIEALLRRRTESLGIPLDLASLGAADDALSRWVEGGGEDGPQAGLGDIARLLWDYALGNPTVALWCWTEMLSVHPEGRLHIHMFTQPDVEHLERLPDAARFVLACVAWHTEVSAEEVALSLRLPLLTARQELKRLREMGVLARRAERYALDLPWVAPTLRWLRRKHLINEA
jgi:hypothetical protein